LKRDAFYTNQTHNVDFQSILMAVKIKPRSYETIPYLDTNFELVEDSKNNVEKLQIQNIKTILLNLRNTFDNEVTQEYHRLHHICFSNDVLKFFFLVSDYYSYILAIF